MTFQSISPAIRVKGRRSGISWEVRNQVITTIESTTFRRVAPQASQDADHVMDSAELGHAGRRGGTGAGPCRNYRWRLASGIVGGRRSEVGGSGRNTIWILEVQNSQKEPTSSFRDKGDSLVPSWCVVTSRLPASVVSLCHRKFERGMRRSRML